MPQTQDREVTEWLREQSAQAKFDLWHLCDELSVVQAALLIAGCDPSGEFAYADGWDVHERPPGYVATKAALTHAILSGRLPAIIRRSAWERGWDEDERTDEDGYPMLAPPKAGEYTTKQVRAYKTELTDGQTPAGSFLARGVTYRAEPDWSLTTIRVDALREWLAHRGLCSGFFFPQATDAPDYLDPHHPRYAPKLAAAVRAWLAVDDPKGKTPKQALMKWLREHAAEFNLSDDEGQPNELGIDECAKVANWQPSGGAPKTPGA